MTEQEKAEQQKKEELYDPDNSNYLDGAYFEEDDEDECYYGCDFCLDSFLRDNCGCIGCEVITPPKKGENKEEPTEAIE